MIAQLHGEIIHKYPQSVIINVNNVGYLVNVSTQTIAELPLKSTAVTLKIYHHITEGHQALYGFFNNEEQELFEKLITVKGVGPKIGLGILSGMPVVDIRSAIQARNVALLSKIPGIGKKSAERIILELSDKVGEISSHDLTSGSNDIGSDALAALLSLGYKQNDAAKAIQKVIGTQSSKKDTSEIIKASLRELNS